LEELMALVETLEMTFEELAFGRAAPSMTFPPGPRREITKCVNGLVAALKPMLERPAPGRGEKEK
jgi:hypothetical protein